MSDKKTVTKIAQKFADERILNEANRQQFMKNVERKLERSHSIKPIQVFDQQAKRPAAEVSYPETNKSRER